MAGRPRSTRPGTATSLTLTYYTLLDTAWPDSPLGCLLPDFFLTSRSEPGGTAVTRPLQPLHGPVTAVARTSELTATTKMCSGHQRPAPRAPVRATLGYRTRMAKLQCREFKPPRGWQNVFFAARGGARKILAFCTLLRRIWAILNVQQR